MNDTTKHGSPWEFQNDHLPAASASFDRVYDCLIVGAGITGLSTGLVLQTEGKSTIVCDSYFPGFGTTGATSAHINTFADTTFKEASDAFGHEGAQLFADAIQAGFSLIEGNVLNYEIACDFEFKPAFVYAETEEQSTLLEEILQSAKAVGVAAEVSTETPIPVPFKKALCFEHQAQFDPVKYLEGLVTAYLQAGGTLCTGTPIDKTEHRESLVVAFSGEKQLKAKALVYATHIPPNLNIFNLRCAAYRSYILALRLKHDAYPNALIYDVQEPYHYIRTHVFDGEKLLLIGGSDHKTGHDDSEKAMDELKAYSLNVYPDSEVVYEWSSQYYVPVDGLPYIGAMPGAGQGIYCATGFNGNGMMLGSVSAKIIADLILERPTPFASLFSPSRMKPLAGFKDFITENADTAYHFVADHFAKPESLNHVNPGEGAIVELNGKKVAAFKDVHGTIHALNATCTHAKCIVAWNSLEKSWDCPCHGARFDIAGKILNGPAVLPLEKLQ